MSKVCDREGREGVNNMSLFLQGKKIVKKVNYIPVKVTANLLGKSFVSMLFLVKLQETIHHRKSKKMKNPNI